VEPWLFGLALGGALLLLIALGYPLFLGKIYVDTDLGRFHLPLRAFYSQCLAAGDSFLWFPNFFSGFYLHGEGQAGLYHPLNLLLYATLPLPLAFNLELLRNYAFLLAGTFLLLRRWELPRDAAMLGALFFSFSSFNFLHYMHLNLVAAAAHIPWLLLAIDVSVRGQSQRQRALGALALALLTTSQLLLGHPQAVWNSVVVEVLYAGFTGLRGGAFGRLLAVAAAKGVGVLTASLQLVPLFESVQDSFRAGPGDAFVNTIALHPANLMQLVAPSLFETGVFGSHPHEQALYVVVLGPVLVVWLGLRWRALGRWRPLAGAALVLAALSLILALGDWGLLYRIQTRLPVVGLFRAPARYLLLFDLAVAVTVAIAFLDLRRLAERGPRQAWRALWPLALLPMAALVIAGWALWYPDHAPDAELAAALAPPAHLSLGPALVITATLIVVAAARQGRVALFALVLFAGVDQAAYGLARMWRQPAAEIATYVESQPGPPRGFRHRALWEHTALTVKGVRLASGYAALLPKRELDLGRFRLKSRQAGQDHPGVANARRVAGVGWLAGTPVPDPLPRARLVTRAVASDHVTRDIATIDVARVALVSEPIDLPEGQPGRVRVARERPGDLQLLTRAPTRQLLVVAERYHPGWRAYVDGAPCPVLRVYADFMGCVVDSGHHDVEFSFEPRSLRLGAWLSALGLGLTLLGFGGSALRS